MSTDYTYDEQVGLCQTLRLRRCTNPGVGSILPLFYLNHLRPCYSPPDLFPFEAQQRYATCAFSEPILKDLLLRLKLDLEITAPRIKSDFKPQHEDLIQGQKRKQWRRERRLKRILTVAVGFFTIAWMMYLITVTSTAAPKIWDPYSILEISRVSL